MKLSARAVAYCLIALGVYYFARAADDEQHGIATVRPPSSYSQLIIIKRSEYPGQFRDLMFYEWLRSPIVLCGGFIILGFCKRADKFDLLSPDFAGNSSLDELDKTLSEAQEKQHRPLKW